MIFFAKKSIELNISKKTLNFEYFEQIYGESKREPPVEDWKKCAVSWHFGIEAIGAQIGGKSLQV